MENRNKELRNIFKGIINRDENEFNKLYKNYKSLIYAIVFSMLKNKEDSDEVAQIVFTKIWNMKVENFPTDKETTWLYNVTKNETINYLRKQKNTVNIDELYYINETSEEIEEIIDKEYYNNILSKLNTKEQEIVSLKILSNLSFKEIANILNIPMGTVQWRYYKSLHTLKILISNLSMFILTITIFIKQKIKSQKTTKNSDNVEKEEQHEETISTENKEIEQDSALKDSKKEQAMNSALIKEENTSKYIENPKEEIVNEGKVNNTKYNIITENTIVETQTNLPNNSILYISTVFLIITIVFLTIVAKQQIHKKRRNM